MQKKCIFALVFLQIYTSYAINIRFLSFAKLYDYFFDSQDILIIHVGIVHIIHHMDGK